MTISTSRTAYTDCYDLFDQALSVDIGIRVRCESKGMANNLRMRLHYARGLDRRLSMEINLPSSPLHGVSAYDPLVVKLHQDREGWWIYIEPRRVQGEIQELEASP